MAKGKFVLVLFPFDGLSTTKVCPAVCLTNSIGQYQHIILALITSQIPTQAMETDTILDASNPDFTASGLRKPSTVKLDFLVTLRSSVILRELGQLSEHTQDEISRKLCKLLSE